MKFLMNRKFRFLLTWAVNPKRAPRNDSGNYYYRWGVKLLNGTVMALIVQFMCVKYLWEVCQKWVMMGALTFYEPVGRAVSCGRVAFERTMRPVGQIHEKSHSEAQQKSGEENRGEVAETSLQHAHRLLPFALRRRHPSVNFYPDDTNFSLLHFQKTTAMDNLAADVLLTQ
jgi:hypothetical protein